MLKTLLRAFNAVSDLSITKSLSQYIKGGVSMDMYNASFNGSDSVELSPDDAKIKDICERIDILLDSYKQENSIDDYKQESQQVFVGALMYTRFNLFDADKSLLHLYSQGVSNKGHITDMYNDYVISRICDYYIYLCHRFNKIPKPIDFSYFTGIDLDTLKRWERLENERPRAYGTIKSLRKTYESALENGAQSGKNPVGFIATLNHRFGWAQDNKPHLTVNINRTQEQIMSTFDTSLLSDNQTKQP